MNISSCKICGKNRPKVARPKAPSGFVGKINEETGKHWLGAVCDECAPTVRKTKYRPHKDYPEITCEGCGQLFKPKRKLKKNVCSNKCAMRVARGNTAERLGKTPNPEKLSPEYSKTNRG